MKAEQLDSRIDAAISKAASGVHHAVDKTEEMSHQANHSIRDTGNRLLETERKWVQASDRYLHRHPFMVVGVAVAVGFILNALLRSPTR